MGLRLRRAARFTPTRVGRLPLSPIPPPPRLVHPHTRGEIETGIKNYGENVGSPPHAWGDSFLQVLQPMVYRFTPTRVGRLTENPNTCPVCTVHPHTRGEIC